MAFWSKIRIYNDLYRHNKGRTRGFARHDFDVFLGIKERLERYSRVEISGKKILDIGCGQRFPNVLLFSISGNKVTGIDLDIVGKRFSLKKYPQILKINGIEKLIKVFAREILFDGLYFKELRRLCGSDSNMDFDVKFADAMNLPFEDESFDMVISNATFEHIPDVPKAVSEMKRVMNNGGVCHIEIHLFTSLSGGHNLKWAFPDTDPPKDVPPWDHLSENRFPAHVYLNRLREHEYRKIFKDNFDVLDWITEYWEGEKFLSPEIEKELSKYSREELLKRSVIVIGKK